MNTLDELLSCFDELSPKELEAHKAETLRLTEKMRWVPNPGPQTDAFFSEADELFYGGAAGGGKTDLTIGLSLEAHHKSLIVRREGPDLDAMEGRFKEVIGHSNGWNGTDRKWRLDGGLEIKLGSCKNEADKEGYQGQAHDLKAFDEICQFTESQYRYISGWNRSTIDGQRCRVLCTGNPPMTPAGYWVKKYWAPWLDRTFPNPALPGELRWATTDPKTGETMWVDKDWSSVDSETGAVIRPRSRTFIPALLKDNPYLGDDYLATLANMPEPLRTQLIRGDFNVAERDQANQVIPTAWVRAAQARWKPENSLKPMISVGADIAQGGADKTSLAPRHLGDHIGEIVSKPGSETPDGPTAAALIVGIIRNGAQVNVDMGGGFGQSTHDHLRDNGFSVLGFVPSATPTRAPPIMAKKHKDQVGSAAQLKYANMRAQAYWEMRLRLDPSAQSQVSLPPDEEMVADLCSPTWMLTTRGIQIEAKDALKKRLSRSPDKGDAVVMAFVDPKDDLEAEARRFPNRLANAVGNQGTIYDPLHD